MGEGLIARSLARPDIGAKSAIAFDQGVHGSAWGEDEICCTAIGRQRRRRKERIAPAYPRLRRARTFGLTGEVQDGREAADLPSDRRECARRLLRGAPCLGDKGTKLFRRTHNI